MFGLRMRSGNATGYSSIALIWLLLLLLLWGAQVISGFVNSPKIITKDGNLLFESGLNRNITFRLSGLSRLTINDEYDVLNLLDIEKPKHGPTSEPEANGMNASILRELAADLTSMKIRAFGTTGLDQRMRLLQNRTRTANQMLRRFRIRLQTVETQVQTITELLETDNCKNNPCENGGTCFNMFKGFMCKCTDNFEGPTCAKDVNECALFAGTDVGCQNEAQCVNLFGGYNCICNPGWFGIHCTQRRGDCMQSSTWELCSHGTCVNTDNNFGYICICDQGWKSNGLTPACQMDIDECTESNPPCLTRCINLPGSFTCAPCPAGLTGNGIKCYDVDECAVDNGGCSVNPRVPCLNTYGSYHCSACPVGWSGDGRTCVRVVDTDENGIASGVTANCANNNICHPNATCTVVSSTVVCSCPLGMVGNGIGVHGCVQGTALNCNALPCLNGGTCIDDGPNNYTCVCPPGFREPNCNPGPNLCVPSPCKNGGRCLLMAKTADFECQCTPGYIGRLCDKRFTSCGGLLSGLSGSLKFPTDSALYMYDEQCSWVLRTNETMVLNVTFNDFRLEASRECSSDWLQINDGKTSASQVIGRFCGTHKPMGGNIISTTNFLYLWFRSDNATAGEGFDLTWNSIPPMCGGPIEVETHGTIASPGSPSNYPKNRDCRWLLHAPNDKRLKLTFFNLQIEIHDSCNYDYLKIIDAISGEVLRRYCNSSRPTPLLLPTNMAIIHFHSDNEGSDTGFQIYYSTEQRVPGCGGTYTNREGTIKSPATIENSVSCEYDIQLGSSESIKIEFIKFELNDTDCIEFYDINTEKQINELQSKFCGEYNIVPPTFNSFYNHLRIKYYSKGGQFELKYKADCTYKFEGETGTITSPGYPAAISRVERYCVYKILTPPNTVVSLNVFDFELNDSSLGDNDCAYTYLKIDDFNGRNIVGPSCGNNTPPVDIVSTVNLVTVHFQSALTSYGRGFKINYKAIPMGDNDCGGVYTKPGSIRLPTGDDGVYMHDMNCFWAIMAPIGKHISLNWKSINLEPSPDCTYDYIEIYDSLENMIAEKHFGRYCQSHPPVNILSQSRVLIIKFVSDSSEARDGFEATFEFVNAANQCNINITSSTGKLTSPDWPGNYSNNLDCSWTISGPHGTQIELLIDMFELEESTKCTKDWLEVRNGGTEKSVLIGSYCGKSIPKRLPAFTNQLYLHLHTDNFLNARGFVVRWQIFSNGCGGKLTSLSGEITSPMYPNPYPHMARCEWRIIVKKGSAIHLTVEDMDMEELFNCNYDKLSLFDGRITRMPLLEICRLDDDKPVHVVTKSNELTVRFTTDETNNDRGFRLSYYTNCTRTLTATYGVIESLNYGESFYRNDVDCLWIIQAPKGNWIVLDFFYFDKIDKKSHIVIAESKEKGTLIRTLGEPDTFNTTSDRVSILHKDAGLSFKMEYTMVGCIQTLHRDTGEFTSPNYPNMYPNNVECLWEIRAPIAQSIAITIEEMDLEESTNCTKDYLMISNDVDSVNPKERHCGKQDVIHLIGVNGFHLYVRFSSDAQNNGKGFKVSYHITDKVCGGTITGRNGIIVSPQYPLNYPPNTECEWYIEVSTLHSITFTIEELDLEDFYDCEMDYVEAFEFSDSDSDITYEEVKLFRKCGVMEDLSETEWTTTSNKAFVRFKSDDSQERKGFKITFKENCGERVTVDENYEYTISRSAQGNETCMWQFLANDSTRHIMFRPTHVLLRTHMVALHKVEGDCINDGIKVYDGDSDKGPLLSQFCMTHPNEIHSYGNALTLKVPFGVIGEFEGVYSIVDSYCSAYYDGIRGKFSTPHYPASYSVDINCEWYIVASAGNSLVLTFESIDLEYSEECNKDYVEVRETNERGTLLGLFCGNKIPEPITGRKTIWMKFASDDDIVGEGFLVSYNYAMHNEINGENGTIESPRYPSKFHSNDPYSWRITVSKDYVILLTMKHIIDMDIPHIKFYDGYSDIGVQIDYRNTHIVRSNTNILYFTASRGPFQFEWAQLSKDEMHTNQSAEMMAQLCGKETIILGSNTLLFKSPGYPEGYNNDLNCKWRILPSNQAQHAMLYLTVVDLEDFGNCYADYVRIYSSSDLENWKELDKLCKIEPNKRKEYHGTPYLQLEFVTDSGINKTGFVANLRSKCGSEMTDRRGFVNITKLIVDLQYPQSECIWTIKVRQGRRIRIKFLDSYLANTNDTMNCVNYFTVRNGFADDSPFLGKGKYCTNNITDILETTSNRAYIKFVSMAYPRFKASFRYEEISHVCSDEIILSDETSEDSVKTITSPNYPNIPHPHSECIWKITAPNHHIIVIEFIDNFDVGENNEKCEQEYVQLNDGSTELMPLLGTYCGKVKPNSIYTSGNVLRLKYVTDISEPHTGFKANVSIGRCGGSYYTDDGVINSPDLLYTQNISDNFECVYTIEVEQGNHINLTVDKMQLPGEDNCSLVTHLELKEISKSDDGEVVSDIVRICGLDHTNYIVETNKLIITYKVKGTPSSTDIFLLHYTAIGDRCGETIIASMGLLKTPNYPGGVTRPTHCTWRLRVPKGKRIKVEVLDFDTGAERESNNSSNHLRSFRGRLTFSNDFLMQSVITRFSDNPPVSIYSTDNTMMIDAFLLSFSKHRGFKLRFSSNEDAVLCRNMLDLSKQGNIQLTSINDTSIYCSYDIAIEHDETFVLNVDKFEKENMSNIKSICGFLSPLKMRVGKTPLLPYMMCENGTLPTVRIPVPLTLELSANKRNKLQLLDLRYKVYKCGGRRTLTYDENDVIRQPVMNSDYNGVLECAWLIGETYYYENTALENSYYEDRTLQIELSVNFKGKCEEQYLVLYNGPSQNYPQLGRFCGQSTSDNLIVNTGLFFEYYTANYETESKFNISVKVGSGCGGELTYPYRKITFNEEYKNNVECVWDIVTEPGFHIGLSFEDRFFIEQSENCKKDYLKIQQKNALDDDWVDIKTVCGRTPPDSINTTFTQMRMIFRSDGNITGDGFVAKFSRNCGGIQYATSVIQQLSSPGYPNNYEHNLFCNYTIVPKDPNGAGVLVQFVDFEMEEPPMNTCLFDNVSVYRYGNDDKVENTVLCGKGKTHEFRAKKSISIVLKTDQSFASKGFLLNYSSNVCGGLITNSTTIRTPFEYDRNHFPHSSNCDWILTAPPNNKILIKFEEFDFENHQDCYYDSVEVYKGTKVEEDQRMIKLCGNLTGRIPIISVPSNEGLIHSFTDDRDDSRGFTALISFVLNCDRHIYLGVDNSTFTFSTYANGYDNNLDCSYVFETVPGRQLVLEFSSFHIEESDKCQDDYLELRDGAGPFADLIGQYCGHTMPSRLMSSRNALFIRFVTDSDKTSSGFLADVSSVPLACGQHIIDISESKSAVLKSPENSEGKYLKNLNCFWKIKSDNSIHLKFDKMDIEGPNAAGFCSDDYLTIYNSEDAKFVEKGFSSAFTFNGRNDQFLPSGFAIQYIYCGNTIPDDFFSNSKDLYVKFKTNEEGARTGFQLTATSAVGCFRNFTATQGRITLRETKDHCDVYIKAPKNYTLSLYYNMVILAEYSCEKEYIEVFDAHTNSSLQKICTYTDASKSLFTNTSELRLNINMNSFYTNFDITYLASQHGPGCGGSFYGTTGILTNPFYPNNERSYSDCSWSIRVPSNLRVFIHFDVFDLGAKATCHSDYLQILESQPDGTQRVMRQFCGEDKPGPYRSEKSTLTVRFHKTVNYDGTGWVLHFNGVDSDFEVPPFMLLV